MIDELGRRCLELLPTLEHLVVDHRALRLLVDELAEAPLPVPTWRHPAMPEQTGPLLDAVVWLGNALNFCYWVREGETMWAVPVEGHDEVDALGLFGALHGAAREGVDLGDAAWLVQAGPAGPTRIFDRGRGTLPLREARIAILAEIGQVLQERFGGRLEHALEAAGDDAVGMANFLARTFPSFRDERSYQGHRLPFLKRAQLAAAMLHLRRRALGAPGLRNTARLTAFADYMLPRALRGRGVLRYGPALTSRVDALQLIEPHSPEEVELRIATVGACELILGALRERGSTVDALTLDHWLWSAGQAMDKPHHRVLTTDY